MLLAVFSAPIGCSGANHSESPAEKSRPESNTASQKEDLGGTKRVASRPAQKEEPQVILLPPGKNSVTVSVEVASNPETRQRGLMFREQLAPDEGMLFLFEEPQHLTFWMHNTYLPLDMIFINSNLTVIGVVENAAPLTDDSRSAPGLSQYVLEVNATFARRYGVGAGTRVKFIGVPELPK